MKACKGCKYLSTKEVANGFNAYICTRRNNEYTIFVDECELRNKNGWTYGEDEYGQDGYYCPHCYKHIPLFYDKQDVDFIKDYKYCPFCGVEVGETE